jgi:hypothetical protein
MSQLIYHSATANDQATYFFLLFSSSYANASWIQTFELWIMSQLIYHSVTVNDQATYFFCYFLPPMLMPAGFKPSNLGL